MAMFSGTVFASAFGGQPPALSLFIDGRTVKSNAAFLYASLRGIPLEEAQTVLCKEADRTDWAEEWKPMPDGMLAARVREDWIQKEARRRSGPSIDTCLQRTDEPFMRERSILLRIAAAQEAHGEEETLPEESMALFLSALFDEREKEACTLILRAGRILDHLQEEGKGPDRALLAAAGILEERIRKMTGRLNP